jgi:hypothetical protein
MLKEQFGGQMVKNIYVQLFFCVNYNKHVDVKCLGGSNHEMHSLL